MHTVGIKDKKSPDPVNCRDPGPYAYIAPSSANE